MVIAGVSVSEENHKHLGNIVRGDSKKFSPAVRESLAWRLRTFLEAVVVRIASTHVIDEWVLNRGPGGLNRLELRMMSEVIKRLGADKVYVDCCDVNEGRFRWKLEELVGCNVQLVCEHQADERYPVTSAASVIAKVVRDRAISRIRGAYGEVGSGYSHDHRTKAFLEVWYREKGELPPIVRRSWRTTMNLIETHHR